ncbi:MAG: TIGR03761 family integrating conjugative element protein [Rhodospirillales bacterium]|nr:MAG: TIGR03761 family integrating conjugative element protein [Rhodospirillales bacterium]
MPIPDPMATPPGQPSSQPATPADTVRRDGAATDHPAPGAPGVLRGEASIVLHTRHGQQLYLGRAAGTSNGKPTAAIPGVRRFASQVRQVAIGARAGDPYADWMLVRLDQEIATVEAAYDQQRELLEAALTGCPGISIGIALSVAPLCIPMQFSSPYAFKAAEVVARFDALACQILTAVHTARVPRHRGETLLLEGKRHARRLLQAPARYSFSGASRDDLVHNTARGQAAIARFGAVPDAVLYRQVRPRYERVDGAAPTGPGDTVEPLLDDALGDDTDVAEPDTPDTPAAT